MKKGYIDLPEGQLHYRSLPASSPSGTKSPIIFLHKSASSSISWTKLMHHYSNLGYDTYAPDFPGFGQSFDPVVSEDSPLTTAWYVHVLVSAFSKLGLKRYHVVGHHSGAVLAVEMAVLYEEEVESITLIGPTVMTAEERAAMKEMYFAPFNAPVEDGSHLLKTWDYLKYMGADGDLDLLQREVLDHVRAWKGRNQIYGAVWAQDGVDLYTRCKRPILVMCAKDDVLFKFFHHITELRSDVKTVVVKGANFTPDLDVEGITGALDGFLMGGEK
ncbi:hypothetical protein BP6252_03763 [Coleophoma cylindrospora]|uniref:AB hydrolase-1 domain-containing protein n=1 Tax=Coleophoma cylindrospora TaxID=1849047 RepID=A0A3D8S937_9HELO|nr:hypothetical protein BP6252_03763 [Coleophoma cylindrospora]